VEEVGRSRQFVDALVFRHAVQTLPPLYSDRLLDTFPELYYTLAEVASMWNISHEKARRLFQSESGVVRFRQRASYGRRSYSCGVQELRTRSCCDFFQPVFVMQSAQHGFAVHSMALR